MMKRFLIGLAILLFWSCPRPATASDWPQWRGPDRNGISMETGLLPEWPEKGPPLAWKKQGIGGGDGTPCVAAGRIFGMSHRGEDEVVWALSESDGSEIWATRLGPVFEQERKQAKEGPGCAPTVDGDRMYVVGLGGNVSCLRVADGKIVWQRSMTKDFGGIVPRGSYRESPLVDGDRVFCTPGGPETTLAALNKRTGETIWTCRVPHTRDDEDEAEAKSDEEKERPSEAAYSSPIAIDFNGQRQVVQFTAKALVGVAAADGELLWKYEAPSNKHGINCSTPLFHDEMLFASSAYNNGGGGLVLTADTAGGVTATETYFTRRMQNHHGGMVVLDGCLYGANGGNEGGMLTCLEFHTGELLWRDREGPKGALTFADGRLYLRAEDGIMVLVEPSREKFVERGRFEQPERTSLPAWAHPVVANGKLYLRDQDLLLCYDVARKSAE